MKTAKKALLLTLCLIMLLSLTACGGSKLSEEYDEQAVLAKAEELVMTANTLDYEAVHSMLREDLLPALTAQQLESSWGPFLEAAGAFVEITSRTAVTQKSQSTDENYAVAVLVCKYENANLTYTISMDVNLDIVGMYLK